MAAPGARFRRLSVVVPLAGILVVAVGIPVLLAAVTGSLGIPHNDAWSHSKIAQEFARTGRVVLQGWNRTALVGQIVVLGPLGRSITVQQLFVAGLAGLGLLATYGYLARRLGRRRALLGTAVVGVLPEFGLLSTSYMSDVPAFAGVMVCLVLADRALAPGSESAAGVTSLIGGVGARRAGLLAAAALAGVWAATVREQSLAAPAVVIVAAGWQWRRDRRGLRAVALIGVLTVAAVVLFELWRRRMPNGDPPGFGFAPALLGQTGLRIAFSLGLYLAPAVLLVARPGRWSAPARGGAGIVFTLIGFVALASGGDAFLGNFLDPRGAYAGLSLGTRTVLPGWLIWLLVAVACLSLALLTGVLLQAGLQLDGRSLALGIVLVLGTLAQPALGQEIFARYLLPLIPIALVPVLAVGAFPSREPAGDEPGRRLQPGAVLEPAAVPRLSARIRAVAALGALAVLLGTSLAITADGLAFDAARWRAATALQRSGVPATDIDAGMEWVGYHAAGAAVPGFAHPGAAGWYLRYFPSARECYLVSASALPGAEPVSAYRYRSYAVVGSAELLVYRQDPCR